MVHSEKVSSGKHKVWLVAVVMVVLVTVGGVYYFAVAKAPLADGTKATTQTTQNVPKEVQSAGDDLTTVDRTLDTDLNAAELDQDIDTLL